MLTRDPYGMSVEEIDRTPLAKLFLLMTVPTKERSLTEAEARAYAENWKRQQAEKQSIWGKNG